jgi:hypothetical protein
MGRTAVALALFCVALAWSPSIDEPTARIARISNNDVRWTGNFFGLEPRISGKTEEVAETLSDDDVPALIEALDDPQRFVAAHVLLAHVVPFYGPISGGSWLWLDVHWDIKPNGDNVYQYNTKNIPKLRRWWQDNIKQAASRLDET